MNPRPSLREALARADIAELDEASDKLGREIGQAIAVALEEHEERPPMPPAPQPRRFEPTEGKSASACSTRRSPTRSKPFRAIACASGGACARGPTGP
jgi:hypothetical protein